MKFPDSATDQQAAKDFLLQFGLTHPIIDDMRDGKAFSADGNVFLSLQGTVGFQVPNDALARRLSVAMLVTQRRGYLLTWFFAAPHKQELKTLTNERVIFDSAPPVKGPTPRNLRARLRRRQRLQHLPTRPPRRKLRLLLAQATRLRRMLAVLRMLVPINSRRPTRPLQRVPRFCVLEKPCRASKAQANPSRSRDYRSSAARIRGRHKF